MKKVDLLIYQVDETNNRTIEIPMQFEIASVSKKAIDNIVGTACSELFAYKKICQDLKAKGLESRKPVLMNIKAGKIEVDFGSLRSELKQTLKLGSSAKSKRNFALRLYAGMQYAFRETEAKDLSQIIIELENEISANEKQIPDSEGAL